MALPRELRPFTRPRGDLLYKTADETEWTRLESPVDDWKHNCYGITFDHGVIVTQKFHEHGSRCHIKLILKPPIIKTEDGQLTVEAACVQISDPSFSAHPDYKDKAKAIEHAKTLPLALLDKNITAVKLRNFTDDSPGRQGAKQPDDHEIGERIGALIDLGYRTAGATQANASGPSRPKKLFSVLPRRSNRSSEDYADKRTLQERLQAHRFEAEDGEVRLRQRLEYERQTMLQTVSVAINGEWDKKVAVAVAEYRAQSTATMDKIVAQGRV